MPITLTIGKSRIRRFIPAAGAAPDGGLSRAVGLYVYFYAAVVALRFSSFIEMASSPAAGNRLGAVTIAAGLVVLYLAGVLPQILGERASRRARVAVTRRFQANRMAAVGLVLFLFFFSISLLAPLISPYDPAVQHEPAAERYRAPSQLHPMGTDKFGRDVFSRVVYGSRVSLAVGMLAVALSSLVGLVFGSFSGYLGGRVDDLAMRLVDGLLAFPRLLLVLTMLAFFANSFWVVVVLLAATGWMGVARIVRAEVLSLKEREFIQAAVASGVGRVRIVWRHLVPNTLGSVVVAATLRIGTIILLESYLSFLGLGLQPPTPSWGTMVFEGRDVLLSAWWVSAFPGLAIVVAVVSCNLLGDGLRDAVDVKAA